MKPVLGSITKLAAAVESKGEMRVEKHRWRAGERLLVASPLLILFAYWLLFHRFQPAVEVPSLEARLLPDGGTASVLAFAPNGRDLAAGSWSGIFTYWNLDTGKGPIIDPGHASGIVATTLSPDGKLLSSGSSDHTVRIWNLRTNRLERILHTTASLLTFSPDGRTLLALGDTGSALPGAAGGMASLWDVATGHPINEVGLGHETITACAANRDLTVAATASQYSSSTGEFISEVRLWDLVARRHERGVWDLLDAPCLHTMREPIGTISSLAFSPNGRLLASGTGWTVRLWDAHSGALLHSIDGLEGSVVKLAFSPDGKWLAATSRKRKSRRTSHGEIWLWRVGTWQPLARMPSPRDYVTNSQCRGLAFSPDSKHLAGAGWGDAVRIWDIPTAKEIHD